MPVACVQIPPPPLRKSRGGRVFSFVTYPPGPIFNVLEEEGGGGGGGGTVHRPHANMSAITSLFQIEK